MRGIIGHRGCTDHASRALTSDQVQAVDLDGTPQLGLVASGMCWGSSVTYASPDHALPLS